jgi:methyl-accepting chemotaxis protein
MLGISIIVISLVYFLFNSAMSRLSSRYFSMLKRDVSLTCRSVASDIAFEVAAADRTGALSKLADHTKKGLDIKTIAVLDPNREILYQSNDIAKMRGLVNSIKDIPVDEVTVIGADMIGLLPLLPEAGRTVGYIAVVKNIEQYQKDKSSTVLFFLLTSILGISMLAVYVYLVGRRLTRPFKGLVAAAERIANGDLEQTDDLEHSGSRELIRLEMSIRQMAEAMQSQVLAIKNLIARISTISKETEGTMANLASSAAQQAAAVNETAATVEELEKSGQSSAVNAKHIVAAAEKTAEASQRGRQTVEKTYEIIMQIKDETHDISEKSKNLLNSVEEVGNIIQSVNSIAEQSKILAVNASIEAAKAGEFGSGFAVVAQEVKDLAQQSKDATLQITGTLTAIRTAIETMVSTARRGKERTAEGVNTIANAGAVMNDLSEAIRENSDFAKLIATNIQQQTIGLTQIAAAIEQINTTALENQSISRNIVQGTKQLSETLALLSDMVSRWRTPSSKA